VPQPVHRHSEAYEECNDGIANFTICVHPGDDTRPVCAHCKQKSLFTIMYRDGSNGITGGLMRRYGLPVERTLLKSAKNWLCVGCYGKLQRQITHIVEKGADKGLNAA
jgi:hypothetical protein